MSYNICNIIFLIYLREMGFGYGYTSVSGLGLRGIKGNRSNKKGGWGRGIWGGVSPRGRGGMKGEVGGY